MINQFNTYTPKQFIETVDKYSKENWRGGGSIKESCLAIYNNVENFIMSYGNTQQHIQERPSIQKVCEFITTNEYNLQQSLSDPSKRQLLSVLGARMSKEFFADSEALKTATLINHYTNMALFNISDILMNIFSQNTENNGKEHHLKNLLLVSKTFYKWATVLKNQKSKEKFVSLKFCGLASIDKIVGFVNGHHITKIDLKGLYINDEMLNELASKCKIEALKMNSEGIIKWPEMKYLKQIFLSKGNLQILAALSSLCPNVEKIRLKNCSSSKKDLPDLIFPNLSILKFTKSFCLTDQALTKIVLLPQLKKMDLGRTDLADDHLKNLFQICSKLEKINFFQCERVTCESLNDFNQYLNPFKISFFNNFFRTSSNLKEINLESTGTTNKGVRALTDACPNLEKINLSNTEVSDQSLIEIGKKCAKLKSINLTRTNVTAEGVEKLIACCHDLDQINLEFTGIYYRDFNYNQKIDIIFDQKYEVCMK